MTGASFPDDCDVLVPVEDLLIETFAERGATKVSPKAAARVVPGQFIHRMGSDFDAGETLVNSGTKLGAAHIGLAASIGALSFQVSKIPHITIITTGDELIPPESTPLAYQLRQSNGPCLRAALIGSGIAQRLNQVAALSGLSRPDAGCNF